jgi:hypothetical protein
VLGVCARQAALPGLATAGGQPVSEAGFLGTLAEPCRERATFLRRETRSPLYRGLGLGIGREHGARWDPEGSERVRAECPVEAAGFWERRSRCGRKIRYFWEFLQSGLCLPKSRAFTLLAKGHWSGKKAGARNGSGPWKISKGSRAGN